MNNKILISFTGDEQTEITHAATGNKIITDLPPDNEGRGRTFSPTDLFTASLGSCIVTIMGKMAVRDGYNIDGTIIEMEKVMSDRPPRRVIKLLGKISFPSHLNDTQKKKLMAAVNACPVHKSLHPEIEVRIE